MDGARGRRSALALCDGDDQLMADAIKKHEEQKALFRAPSKHAPSALDSDDISRGQSIHPSTQGTGAEVGIGPSPSKSRICTEMASWAQYPLHTRADRCGPAGRADAVSAIDFAAPSRLRVQTMTPIQDETVPVSLLRRRPTNSSKRSKRRYGLVKSTSQGLERVTRYYSNLFATTGFRGNNRRTSVSASTGILQHPELEMLTPAASMDSHQPVHDHLKRVDADLGMLSSAFRLPSFSKFGHRHDRGTANEDDDTIIDPNEEGDSKHGAPFGGLEQPNCEPAINLDSNKPGMPFRKLSTFFLVESNRQRSKAATIEGRDDKRPVAPEEDQASTGPIQLDGAAADTATIDTLDTIEGAERKSS